MSLQNSGNDAHNDDHKFQHELKRELAVNNDVERSGVQCYWEQAQRCARPGSR